MASWSKFWRELGKFEWGGTRTTLRHSLTPMQDRSGLFIVFWREYPMTNGLAVEAGRYRTLSLDSLISGTIATYFGLCSHSQNRPRINQWKRYTFRALLKAMTLKRWRNFTLCSEKLIAGALGGERLIQMHLFGEQGIKTILSKRKHFFGLRCQSQQHYHHHHVLSSMDSTDPFHQIETF